MIYMEGKSMKDWNDYFMDIALQVATKSKDPSTQVGAVIVTEDNEPVSFGYNGMVRKMDEKQVTWERPDKYYIVIHAEMNAVLFARRDLANCKMYVTHHPCENCLKHVLQSGIKEIYYRDDSVVERFDEHQLKAIDRLVQGNKAILRQI